MWNFKKCFVCLYDHNNTTGDTGDKKTKFYKALMLLGSQT